jgi:hypothetical protein
MRLDRRPGFDHGTLVTSEHGVHLCDLVIIEIEQLLEMLQGHAVLGFGPRNRRVMSQYQSVGGDPDRYSKQDEGESAQRPRSPRIQHVLTPLRP